MDRIWTWMSVFFFASVAYGQDSVEQLPKSPWTTLISPEAVAKIIPIVIAIQVLLYGLAEGLTRISVYTEAKWDNKLAAFLTDATWIMGVLIGKFGYSTPKLVIEEKAKQVAAKQDEKGD